MTRPIYFRLDQIAMPVPLLVVTCSGVSPAVLSQEGHFRKPGQQV